MLRLSVIIILYFLGTSCTPRNKVVESFHSNGQLNEQYTLTADSLIAGLYKRFSNSGILFEEANYIDGRLNGERKLYYPSGALEIKENYLNDMLNGSYTVFYENGKPLLESFYSENILAGTVKKYYKTGGIMEEVKFENNEENGPFVEYYENGNKKWEGTYLNGDNEFGLLLKYNKEGVLVRKMMCDSIAICRTIWESEEAE